MMRIICSDIDLIITMIDDYVCDTQLYYLQVPVGPGTLGRILNVIGEPVDEQGPIEGR